MMRNTKRFLMLPFGGVALVLALSSAAYACTVFKGSFTVQGNLGGSVTVIGLRTGMVNSVSTSKTFASVSGGFVRVSTGTDGCCNRLPNKDSAGNLMEYDINFLNDGYDTHDHWYLDCMAGSGGTTRRKVHLNAAGQIAQVRIAGVYTDIVQPLKVSLGTGLTASTGTEESAICISDSSGSYGNQAPVTIV